MKSKWSTICSLIKHDEVGWNCPVSVVLPFSYHMPCNWLLLFHVCLEAFIGLHYFLSHRRWFTLCVSWSTKLWCSVKWYALGYFTIQAYLGNRYTPSTTFSVVVLLVDIHTHFSSWLQGSCELLNFVLGFGDFCTGAGCHRVLKYLQANNVSVCETTQSETLFLNNIKRESLFKLHRNPRNIEMLSPDINHEIVKPQLLLRHLTFLSVLQSEVQRSEGF